MASTEAGNAAEAARARLALVHEQDLLLRWLRTDAYPLWATQGYDRIQGGFQEALTTPAQIPSNRVAPGCRRGRFTHLPAPQAWAGARRRQRGW